MVVDAHEPFDAGAVPRSLRVLRHVAAHDTATEAEVAAALGLERADVHATMAALEKDKLIVRAESASVDASADARWVALPPRSALGALLAHRRAELALWERHVDDLASAYHAAVGREEESRMDIVTGSREVGVVYRHLLETATSEVLHLCKPPYLAPDREAGHSILGDPTVDVRGVYESASLTGPMSLETALTGRGSSTRLRLASRVPFKLVVVDRKTALIPAGGGTAWDTSLVVHTPALVGALAELFELVWRAAVPQELWRSHDGDHPAQDADAEEGSLRSALVAGERLVLEPRTRTILDLMASGLTDEAIGRLLDVSRRTVQKEVSDLAERLGARTRFQIGLLASERGLVSAHGETFLSARRV